jgi:biopolymer transport protein TolR
MSLKPQASASAIRSEINVTPLVDVCLVLLIIFMVVVPVIQAGVPVDLPKTGDAPPMPAEAMQLTVSIQEDGSVYVRDVRVADADLRAFLAAVQAGEPDKQVIVRGDQSLQYGKVAEVLAVLRDVGYTRMGLILEKAPR